MNYKDCLDSQFTIGTTAVTDYINGLPYAKSLPYITTRGNGITKLEHFMLELTKAVASRKGYETCDPTIIVNRAQAIFEVLKKRIEDIESKGLISDNNS